MSSLSGVSVTSESTAPCEIRTQNTVPILHEIRHALQILHESSEPSSIDLHAMPMSSAEIDELESLLGSGEVTISINTLGNSTIRETGYPGVWFTTHLDEEGQVQSRFIEIATIPEIVPANSQEIGEAGSKLTMMLENLTDE